MQYHIKYLLLIVGILLTSSCTKNDIFELQEDVRNVTLNFRFSADIEDNNIITRAINDGNDADILYYAVVSNSGKYIVPKASIDIEDAQLTSKAGFSLSFTLPFGEKYRAVFWAQSKDSEAYELSDEMTVSVDYSLAGNSGASDAFYGVSEYFSTSDENVDVTLRRPFAQLNIGAFPFEWEYVNDVCGFEIKQSSLRVSNVPHKINLFTGEVSENGTAIFKPRALPEESMSADVDGNGVDEQYTYVAMAYVLAVNEPSQHSADIFFLNSEGKAVKLNDSRLNSLSLQRNCRTDFLGQVLSEYGELNIREYDDDGNTEDGNVYFNFDTDSTIEDVIYNMSSHNTALQFASTNGQTITYNNLLFTGDIWTIELGEYRGSSYVNYKNVLNNVELRNLSVSSCIECHEWYFSPASIAYGESEFNNCVMKGTTTIRTTVVDKHGVEHTVIPVDVGVRNESDAVFNGGEYGTIFAWTHAVVEIYDAIVDILYCGTCDSTKHSWMTIGSGTVIDKVICCEPRCPYGGKEYSTTMTIKSGAKVGSLQLVSEDVEFLIIEDGAEVGPITCNGVQYTYQELREKMGLNWKGL